MVFYRNSTEKWQRPIYKNSKIKIAFLLKPIGKINSTNEYPHKVENTGFNGAKFLDPSRFEAMPEFWPSLTKMFEICSNPDTWSKSMYKIFVNKVRLLVSILKLFALQTSRATRTPEHTRIYKSSAQTHPEQFRRFQFG